MPSSCAAAVVVDDFCSLIFKNKHTCFGHGHLCEHFIFVQIIMMYFALCPKYYNMANLFWIVIDKD